MKLKIINKPDGSGYLIEFITNDNVKVLDRWQVTAIEFENFCWQSGQFKGRYEDLKELPKQGSGNKEDKIFRKIVKISLEIAELSAYKDSYKEWWGMDTNIGDLPFEIKKKLSKFLDYVNKI